MTNPGSSPEPPKTGFKVTLLQGVIGAVSLAGTTAIPLVVQRLVAPAPPVSSPPPVPAQVSSPSPQVQPTLNELGATLSSPTPVPAQVSPPYLQMQPTLNELGATQLSDDDDDHGKGNGKRKGKKDD